MSPETPSSTPNPTEITGWVTEIGTSRGKTIAAWDGVPTGKPYLRVKIDKHIVKPTRSGLSVHVWFPQQDVDPSLYQEKHVRLYGTWHPPKEEPQDIYEHRQQPIAPIVLLNDDLLNLNREDWKEDGSDNVNIPPKNKNRC